MQQLKILIWHVHGSYLYYLTQAPHQFFLPSSDSRSGDLIGKWGHIPWGENVHDVPVADVPKLDLDLIIFQLPKQYQQDQYDILSESQRRLPKIYLEHDPPYEHPANARHIVDDPEMLLVHVTPFNALMWDSGRTPTMVVDHGVTIPPEVRYSGEIAKGIVAVNHLARRGRIVGADIVEQVRKEVPLDIIGMAAEESGGLGEVLHKDLPAFISRYRFFFHPMRYTSLGLALCEAMMVGMPIVGLATTELVTVIQNGESGYIDTNITTLVRRMHELVQRPQEARHLGVGARTFALQRFSIRRFIRDWNKAFGMALRRSKTHITHLQ